MTTSSVLLPASRFTPTDIFLARKELATRSLPDFALMVDIPTVPVSEEVEEDRFETLRLSSLAGHHYLICSKIQDLVEGRIPNLMLLFPPGSAKSTYADVVAVPWYMGKYPRKHVILASYASEIAKKQGRRARQLIRSKSYQNLIGATLRKDQNAADEWALDNGSEFMAGGLLSGLTGNRAWLGILDDPIRGREAAESQTIRDKTWDAYTDDFCSRLVPGAPQIMILTRWHEDDPAGRILPEGWSGESGWFDGRDGRRWYVICCPAIAEREDDPLGRQIGESLWPEWFSHEHWKPFQKNARSWTSLYQQRPAPDEGTFFKREHFRRFDVLPKNLNYYMTSDHAPGDGNGTDWNVFRIWGIDSHQHVYMVAGYRTQGTLDKALGIETNNASGDLTLLSEGALPLIKKWKPFCWFPEDDNNWKASKAFVIAAMRRLKIPCRIEALSPHGQDKATKARPIQAKASMGEVWMPNGMVGDVIIDECIRFPAGRNDDEVDTLSLIGRAIDQAHPAIVKPEDSTKPKDMWATPDRTEGDWRTA